MGLRVAFDFVNSEGGIFGIYLACGESTINEVFDQALAAKQWGGDTEPLQAGNRYGHLCLEATGLADLRTTVLAQGVQVGEIRSGLDQSLQMWTADSDGKRAELTEYTHRSRQLRVPRPA